MVFLDGTTKDKWSWAAVKAVVIPDEDRKSKRFPEDQTHKMDMSNLKQFAQNDFMTALEHIDFYQQ